MGTIIFTSFQHLGIVLNGIKTVYMFFSPVIAALCIAFVLNILLRAFETKVFAFMDNSKKSFVRRLKRPVSLVLTYLIAVGIVFLLILVIIPELINTVTLLAEKMPSFVLQARKRIEVMLDHFNLSQRELPDIKINWDAAADAVKNWLSGSSGHIVNSAVDITASVLKGVFDAIFSIFISVYVLAQKEKIGAFVKKTLRAFVPEKANSVVLRISYCAADSFSKFIGGQLIEAIILGVLCFIGMIIFRFPNALLISVIISVTALVPIVGSTIGLVLGILLILITNPIKALLFIPFFLILQQFEGNVIYPKVVGKAVGLPGVIVVSAVLVGGNIAGVIGALISVPTASVLYILLKDLTDYMLKKKAKTDSE